MEPDLMEVGSTLEEAKQLRREHDELLTKLNVSLAHNDDFTDLCYSTDTGKSCVLLQTRFRVMSWPAYRIAQNFSEFLFINPRSTQQYAFDGTQSAAYPGLQFWGWQKYKYVTVLSLNGIIICPTIPV